MLPKDRVIKYISNGRNIIINGKSGKWAYVDTGMDIDEYEDTTVKGWVFDYYLSNFIQTNFTEYKAVIEKGSLEIESLNPDKILYTEPLKNSVKLYQKIDYSKRFLKISVEDESYKTLILGIYDVLLEKWSFKFENGVMNRRIISYSPDLKFVAVSDTMDPGESGLDIFNLNDGSHVFSTIYKNQQSVKWEGNDLIYYKFYGNQAPGMKKITNLNAAYYQKMIFNGKEENGTGIFTNCFVQ